MRETILTNWNWARAFQLGVGLWVVTAGVLNADYIALGIGAWFTYQALMNRSCCGVACAVPTEKAGKAEVQYEEVKGKD